MRKQTDNTIPAALAVALTAADGRRRLRSVIVHAARALWPGLILAIVAAIAWRLTSSTAAAVAIALSVAGSIVTGALRGLRSPDLIRAAEELDRRRGLEATLSTGLEVSQGRLGGEFAPIILEHAEKVAGTIPPATVPVQPGPRARYLSIPAAVLAGLLLLPSMAQIAPGMGSATRLVDAAAGSGEGNVKTVQADLSRDPAARRIDRKDVVGELAREAESASKSANAASELEPPENDRRNLAKARAQRRAAARRADPEATAGGGAAADAGPAANNTGVAGSEVNAREQAVASRRYPEYREIVARYFEATQ